MASALNLGAATLYTYDNGETGNTAQNATVSFDFGNGTLQVIINNLIANPNSVLQGVSGIKFTVIGGLTGTLNTQAGQLITIADNGTFTMNAGTPAWTQQTGFETSVFGGGQPEFVVLGAPGPGLLYSNAGGSITGNDPHNPFVKQTLTLNYLIAGATSSTYINSLFINFNTSIGYVEIPEGRIPPNETGVPEPSTYALIGGALIGIQLLRKRK